MIKFNKKLAIKRVVEIINETYERSKNLINLNISKKKWVKMNSMQIFYFR